ncbi:MAG: YeeE/YedE family protein [Bacteroidetes bacterium]|nr:YeeE/YedE family protein [Bacteroidota bacterium]
MGPLIPLELIASGWDFIIALIIGIAFGFILEASGFSSSRNMAGVFYGYNFVVLRVFLTAVIVAMIGLEYFDYMGWIDINMIYILPTFVTPMIVGAIIMGSGFIIGGFCPGTSFTAIAIGKIDAIVFTLGLFLGIFIFSEIFPYIQDFYNSDNLGNVTISEVLGISNKLITFIFVIIAIAAFYFTWLIEKKVRKNITPYKF